MKTTLSILMTILLVFSFSSCTGENEIDDSKSNIEDIQIEFSNVEINNSWRGDDWEKDWYVSILGNISNKSQTDYSAVYVEFQIYDEYGKTILTINESYRLAAGATLSFREGDLSHWTGKGYKTTVISVVE